LQLNLLVRLKMKRLLSIVFFAMPLVAFAAGKTSVFFPPEAAGGKISLWGSGARIFTGNGWMECESGSASLPLKWEDKKDGRRMFMRFWLFDLPEGRFILGAERKNETVTFTLIREGEKQVLLRSEPFPIETFEDVETKNGKEANQIITAQRASRVAD
jgi:hypothetical protein